MELNGLSNFSPGFGVIIAASIESFLLFAVIAAASAIYNWIKKKNENSEDWSGQQPQPRPRTSPQSRGQSPPPIERKTADWEEELRRLLDIESPQVPPPPPPPVIRKNTPTPPPARPVIIQQSAPKPVPSTFGQQKFYKAHCNHCDGHIEFPSNAMDEMIYCPHCQHQTVLRPFEQTRVETLAHQKNWAPLTQSAVAHQKANRLEEDTRAHLNDLTKHRVGTTSVQNFKARSREVNETLALFRNPQTARQAMIASLILAPPKALET